MEYLEQLTDWITGLPHWAAWLGIILATFVSEDLTCIAAGLLAASGQLAPWTAISAAGAGIFLGDLGLYAAGRYIGRAALTRSPIAWFVHDEDVAQSQAWFEHRGPVVILLGRFVPGSRLPTYFAAGLVGTGFWRFALYAALAVVVWAPLLAGGAMLLGQRVLPLVELYELYILPAILVVALTMVLVTKFLVPSFTWRGRRMVLSRWRRLTRWEFWPPWVFYIPVLVHVLWLALRHRSLTLFTAVNPSIPAGGFIGESKAAILQGLAAHPRFVARTALIPAAFAPAEKVRAAREFMQREGLDWPVVLKPDAGQRGSGVAVVRSQDELEAYLGAIRADAVVQEHCPGAEFGVFYFRYPEAERGQIFAITTKHFPAVVGDGHSTLEHLILADDRAVCMARFFLERHAGRLWDVPASGERVPLGEIGNHCRGAVFRDGTAFQSEAMLEAFERISRGYEGFYFGRYDVVAPSLAALRAGEAFKIIELNGGTSEATSIYDPSNGVLDAYRVLFEQWRILFRIAAANVRRGAPRWGAVELLKMLGHYRQAARSHPT